MAARLYASMTSLLLLLLLLLAASLSKAGEGERVARTRLGAVRGVHKESSSGRRFLAFYNLPYARPPVGPLRFRSPQPPDAWVHIRDATVAGPVCPQNSAFSSSPIGAEDCLYLNVFTPALNPEQPLPVMFWIHGGGWFAGSAVWYEPNYLMDHDVVLVTINYRLGPLGFLSTEDEAAPGNFGLKDQVAALKWVKENIESFGGDPNSVTIFGNSAGAASVHYLILSPKAEGLFHRAISQSGVALSPWGLPEPAAAEKARRLATLVGCPTEPSAAQVECLRSVDEYKIIATEENFHEWMFHPLIPFRPVVEDEGEDAFLSQHPVDMEPHTVVPWLMGATKEEGCLVTAAFFTNETLLREFERDSDRLFPLTLLYRSPPEAKIITKKIYDFYFPSGTLSLTALTQLYTDRYITWNTDDVARKYKDRAPVYLYLFSYNGKFSLSVSYGAQDKDVGACHGDDLYYLFSNLTFCPVTSEVPEKDQEIVRLMTKLWTNFATTGNPTPNEEPLHWPRVTSEADLEYLDIGQKLEVKTDLMQQRGDFWRSLPLIHHHSAVKEEL
ncbi:juvenile hormone esterase-like isoform X1 [Schistocerca americana]|uniref:juvenile hormone esterase-like isoform X1 n=1 Tax=Schistocerca americana TaxID=7009 RepID=UPI001F4F74FD|nr:juvenile hormone esterase-like isoform X1 [Schistocerca americana]